MLGENLCDKGVPTHCFLQATLKATQDQRPPLTIKLKNQDAPILRLKRELRMVNFFIHA
jgi:hypothetical protein